MPISHLMTDTVRTLCGAKVTHRAWKSRFPMRMYRPLGDQCTGCTVDGVEIGQWHGKPDGEICKVVAVDTSGRVRDTTIEAPTGRVERAVGDSDVDKVSKGYEGQKTLF